MLSKNIPKHINSLESLLAEKLALKNRLREREIDFKERAAKLPVEIIKATAGKVIPFFMNKRVAATSWMVLKGIFGIFYHKRGAGKTNKTPMLASLKQWGFVTLAKTVYGLFSK